jgi:Ca2+-binding EF-hand superfamily protein
MASQQRGDAMMTRRTAMLGIVAAGAVACLFGPAVAAPKRSKLMQMLDPDNDGTVDLQEAKDAASAQFDRLDRNKDGVLSPPELKGRLSARDFAAANPDRDGTLDKNEYLSVVEKRFNAANPDNDGTLDEKELQSRAGRALQRLLR